MEMLFWMLVGAGLAWPVATALFLMLVLYGGMTQRELLYVVLMPLVIGVATYVSAALAALAIQRLLPALAFAAMAGLLSWAIYQVWRQLRGPRRRRRRRVRRLVPASDVS